MSESEQTVGKATAQIDWRKLLLPLLFIMVLPTIAAFLLDLWLGSLPFITIAAILICFPTATFFVIRIALLEMDRVIAEVAPLATEPLEEALPPDPAVETDVQAAPEAMPEPENRVEGSPTP